MRARRKIGPHEKDIRFPRRHSPARKQAPVPAAADQGRGHTAAAGAAAVPAYRRAGKAGCGRGRAGTEGATHRRRTGLCQRARSRPHLWHHRGNRGSAGSAPVRLAGTVYRHRHGWIGRMDIACRPTRLPRHDNPGIAGADSRCGHCRHGRRRFSHRGQTGYKTGQCGGHPHYQWHRM